jgi:glycosyltransferase involved in cell wall biosynthesis
MDGQVGPVRILWLSNPPWVGSGYGQQTALFVPKLAELGHELAVASNYGFHDAQLNWKGLRCYPADGVYGNRTLSTYAHDFHADQVIALCDAWVLNPDEWPDLSAAVWAPVDHTPLPAMVHKTLGNDRVRPVAMSRFGERMMRDAGLEPLYVPHGIETTLFKPRPELRDQARDELGVPRDAFLVGMVAANVGNQNVPRKAFAQTFTGFARFAATHPDAWFYCHSEGNPRPGTGGINLYELAERRGLPQGRIRIPADKAWHLGIPAEFLAFTVYQALDTLILCSMGEGFGIPLVEAQACGVPVIASDHSAMTELTHAGWLVGGDPWDDPVQKADFIVPSVGAITDALEAAYQARHDQVLRAAATEFARGYDADLVVDRYWRPALTELAGGATPPASMNRAQRRARRKKALA